VRRSEWFVTPSWIGGRPTAARSVFALSIVWARMRFETFARCIGVPFRVPKTRLSSEAPPRHLRPWPRRDRRQARLRPADAGS
jgi:hypothetical protein